MQPRMTHRAFATEVGIVGAFGAGKTIMLNVQSGPCSLREFGFVVYQLSSWPLVVLDPHYSSKTLGFVQHYESMKG